MVDELKSPGLLYPDRSRELGKSMPMNDMFPSFSAVAVYQHRAGLKFAHVTAPSNRWLVVIFMDNVYTEHEMNEWQTFSDHIDNFRAVGASLLGVATDSHMAIRAWLAIQNRTINFPIMADRDREFTRSMGACYLGDQGPGGRTVLQAARAVAILSPQGRLVHLTVNNESTFSDPLNYIQMIRNLNVEDLRQDHGVTYIHSERIQNEKFPWANKVRQGLRDGASSVVSFFSKSSKSDNVQPNQESDSKSNATRAEDKQEKPAPSEQILLTETTTDKQDQNSVDKTVVSQVDTVENDSAEVKTMVTIIKENNVSKPEEKKETQEEVIEPTENIAENDEIKSSAITNEASRKDEHDSVSKIGSKIFSYEEIVTPEEVNQDVNDDTKTVSKTASDEGISAKKIPNLGKNDGSNIIGEEALNSEANNDVKSKAGSKNGSKLDVIRGPVAKEDEIIDQSEKTIINENANDVLETNMVRPNNRVTNTETTSDISSRLLDLKGPTTDEANTNVDLDINIHSAAENDSLETITANKDTIDSKTDDTTPIEAEIEKKMLSQDKSESTTKASFEGPLIQEKNESNTANQDSPKIDHNSIIKEPENKDVSKATLDNTDDNNPSNESKDYIKVAPVDDPGINKRTYKANEVKPAVDDIDEKTNKNATVANDRILNRKDAPDKEVLERFDTNPENNYLDKKLINKQTLNKEVFNKSMTNPDQTIVDSTTNKKETQNKPVLVKPLNRQDTGNNIIDIKPSYKEVPNKDAIGKSVNNQINIGNKTNNEQPNKVLEKNNTKPDKSNFDEKANNDQAPNKEIMGKTLNYSDKTNVGTNGQPHKQDVLEETALNPNNMDIDTKKAPNKEILGRTAATNQDNKGTLVGAPVNNQGNSNMDTKPINKQSTTNEDFKPSNTNIDPKTHNNLTPDKKEQKIPESKPVNIDTNKSDIDEKTSKNAPMANDRILNRKGAPKKEELGKIEKDNLGRTETSSKDKKSVTRPEKEKQTGLIKKPEANQSKVDSNIMKDSAGLSSNNNNIENTPYKKPETKDELVQTKDVLILDPDDVKKDNLQINNHSPILNKTGTSGAQSDKMEPGTSNETNINSKLQSLKNESPMPDKPGKSGAQSDKIKPGTSKKMKVSSKFGLFNKSSKRSSKPNNETKQKSKTSFLKKSPKTSKRNMAKGKKK